MTFLKCLCIHWRNSGIQGVSSTVWLVPGKFRISLPCTRGKARDGFLRAIVSAHQATDGQGGAVKPPHLRNPQGAANFHPVDGTVFADFVGREGHPDF
jgi:hypothetical protein